MAKAFTRTCCSHCGTWCGGINLGASTALCSVSCFTELKSQLALMGKPYREGSHSRIVGMLVDHWVQLVSPHTPLSPQGLHWSTWYYYVV